MDPFHHADSPWVLRVLNGATSSRRQTVLSCILPPTPLALPDHQIGLASPCESIVPQQVQGKAGTCYVSWAVNSTRSELCGAAGRRHPTEKTQIIPNLDAAVQIKSNRLSASKQWRRACWNKRWNPFFKLGVSGNCGARVEVKVWGVKEHPQWEDEEQRVAEECEGGVEWDENDCWLKRARPNGWVDRTYTDWVKNRVALFCFSPQLVCGSQAVHSDHQSL